MKYRMVAIIFAFLSLAFVSLAVAIPDTDRMPPSLEPWKPWVLHGMEEQFCPTSYNDGGVYRCIWPSSLKLDLKRRGGRFTQQWLVFKKGWVPLPGNGDIWPQNVTIDGKAAVVVMQRGIPSTEMEEGEHVIEGAFVWGEMPEMIRVPEQSGLVALWVNGKIVEIPFLDNEGRLWLQKVQEDLTREERIETKIYRLIDDTIPMRVTTHFKISVSGKAREISLENVLLEGFIPMSIKSPLPARIGEKGELMIQARPGRWEIQVLSRSESPVHKIGPLILPYGQEIWAFQSQNHLRMVKVEGVPSIDPKQTDIPLGWKTLPAFVINSDDEVQLSEIRRGDPEPAPDQLHLKRTWWLDFDGKGLTVQDRITGTMSRQWYLAMNRPGILGRVSVDGMDRLITSQGEMGKPGVELRRGHLNLVAESRLETTTRNIPAVGWDHDFQSVSGALNLPPGWRLFTASGVDVIPGTWFERWTLLDLFLVLIISLAVFKLWSWRWGLVALISLVLTYHEPGAPRIVWLHLLAAIALLKLLPDGWIRKVVNLWRLIAIVVLLVLAIPFMVNQVRWGWYPQLEAIRPARWAAIGEDTGAKPGLLQRRTLERAKAYTKKADPEEEAYEAQQILPDKLGYMKRQQAVLVQDPNALVQTGPGLPDWQWRSYSMKWNGPVDRIQQIRLRLLSPFVNLVLSFMRVLLLALMVYIFIDFRKWKLPLKNLATGALFLSILFLPVLTFSEINESAFPPPEILKELKARLLEKPDCLPNCAESPRMELNVNAKSVRILFQVHAMIETAVPLPGSSVLWKPEQVLLNSKPAKGLARDREGFLWILVPRGTHIVTLMGGTPNENVFQIPMPLKPHLVITRCNGWDVEGVDKNGRPEGSLKLTRQAKTVVGPFAKGPVTLPPFLHIKRIISLGLDWQVFTTIRRVTPIGTPVAVKVPLVDGESITTAGIRVEDGKAFIHMGPKAREIRWDSDLRQASFIQLQSPRDVQWTETWVLDASPIWHCDLSGIPIIHHQDQSGHWRPEWQPWPGEWVSITIFRPKAIQGQVVTIDEAGLKYTPGQRFRKADLSLRLRSSQGGQHKMILPKGAVLQSVSVEGKKQPVSQKDREVVVPLRPGSQKIDVEWHESRGLSWFIKGPRAEIGKQAVNAKVQFQMPRKRWILLTGGPRMGPAVLFWSYLVVIALGAFALGRITWTPLKTHHWLLLGLGLTQVTPIWAIIIVGWLLALGLRYRHSFPPGWFSFNVSQLAIAGWTVVALIGLWMSIKKGLLGIPNMQIAGNGSSDYMLYWTQDRIGTIMPRPWVVSVPLILYRFFMLAWALWLAFALMKWLKWGWQCFSEGGLWRKILARKEVKKAKTPKTRASLKSRK